MRGITKSVRIAATGVALAALIVACGSKKHPAVEGQNAMADASDPCAMVMPASGGGGTLVGQNGTVVGRVFDPGGRKPLYNVSVYVARNAPQPLTAGVTCDRCGSTAIDPYASTLTDEDGNFTLTNVPPGTQQLVIQVGKWRKITPVDVAAGCTNAGILTLPKNGSEGDMPQIAVTTGGADALECMLLLIGIDKSEFVAGPGGSGHVHMYNGSGGNGPAGAPDAATLWNDKTKLAAYDLLLLSCEGAEHNENKTNMQAMHDYAEAGGHVFATHYHYTWFKNGPNQDFRDVALWAPQDFDDGASFYVNESFPKGKSFAQWLKNVDASQTLGVVELENIRKSLTTVNPAVSTDWIHLTPDDVKYFSFNAPIGKTADQQCGRVVFSDIHVSSLGGETWPTGCDVVNSLSPQQIALEFLLFDLSSCVQSDSQPPTPVK